MVLSVVELRLVILKCRGIRPCDIKCRGIRPWGIKCRGIRSCGIKCRGIRNGAIRPHEAILLFHIYRSGFDETITLVGKLVCVRH